MWLLAWCWGCGSILLAFSYYGICHELGDDELRAYKRRFSTSSFVRVRPRHSHGPEHPTSYCMQHCRPDFSKPNARASLQYPQPFEHLYR